MSTIIITVLFFRIVSVSLALAAFSCSSAVPGNPAATATGHTEVAIVGDEFYINGRPTNENRSWKGHKIQGLLLNARMIQGIFDDLNPQTRGRWKYPDTGVWDPDRNPAGAALVRLQEKTK